MTRQNPPKTLLMLAASDRKKAYMELLLTYGADAAVHDCDGDDALQYMPRRFFAALPDIVQLLTSSHEH